MSAAREALVAAEEVYPLSQFSSGIPVIDDDYYDDHLRYFIIRSEAERLINGDASVEGERGPLD